MRGAQIHSRGGVCVCMCVLIHMRLHSDREHLCGGDLCKEDMTDNMLVRKTHVNVSARGDSKRTRVLLTQQRRQPINIGFTVGVQEGDDFTFRCRSSQQASPDEPLSLLGPQDTDLWHPLHVLLQWNLQMLCRGRGKTGHQHQAPHGQRLL